VTVRGDQYDEPRVFVSSFSFNVGERTAIGDLADPAVSANIDELHREGIRFCRVSDQPAYELAASAARGSLAAAGVDPTSAIYCAESPGAESFCDDVWSFLLMAGLPSIPSVVISGNACANVVPALTVARNTVLSDPEARVLVVSTNRREYATRFLANGTSVLSDGAAACLVSGRPYGDGFRLLGVGDAMTADFPGAGTVSAGIRAVMRGVKRAALGLPQVDHRGYDVMVTGNYAASVRRLFATAAGVDAHVLHDRLAEDIGHCSSADLLIGLADAKEDGHMQPGDRVLVLGASPRSWSCAELEYVNEGLEGKIS